jgi:hypothetical protein
MRSISLHGLVLVGLWLGGAGLSHAAKTGCYNAGIACKYVRNAQGNPTTAIDGTCPKLPTSLYIVNTGSPAADDGWADGPGLCGKDTRTNQPCGDYSLGNAVCGPGVGIGTPSPDEGDPCDPADAAYDPWACSERGPFDYLTLSPSQASAVVQHLTRVAHQSLPPHVEKAVETLGRASSLHLRARVTLSSPETGDRTLPGVYEYWEKDDKYRMHLGIDQLALQVSEIAFNGHQYQLALGTASTLSMARADERDMVLGVPNPIFLGLQPLSLSIPDCQLCQLRLSDLRTLRELRHTGTPGESSLAPLDSVGVSTKTTLAPSGNLATSVVSKSEVAVVERTEFSDYRPLEGTGMELPRVVRFVRTVNLEGSVVRVAVQYQIDELELDRPIDDSVFTLDRSPYTSIWENDRFVRAPRCSKSPAIQ